MKLSTGILLTFAALVSAAPHANINDLILDKFVMFGDSITQRSSDSTKGFALNAEIARTYIRRLGVVNRGFEGYNTIQAKELINRLIDADTRDGSEIKIMTVYFGSNDASIFPCHVPLQEYANNLAYVVNQAKKSGIDVVVIGLGLVDENRNKGRTNQNFKQYNAAANQVAKQLNVGFVDLRAAFLKELGWKEGDLIPGVKGSASKLPLGDYLIDGMHFTGKGYEVYNKALVSEISSKYPHNTPHGLSYLIPNGLAY